MKWLLGVYTKRFNIRDKPCGPLFAVHWPNFLALHPSVAPPFETCFAAI
jgi:hypothetical protein